MVAKSAGFEKRNFLKGHLPCPEHEKEAFPHEIPQGARDAVR
jgi:hypothetical protein